MDTQALNLQAVVERLAKVEKQNRRLKIAGVLALVLVGAAILVGAAAPKPKTVEAESFVVRDRDGEARAALVVEEGNPCFRLIAENGRTRVMVAFLQDRAGLFLSDEKGRLRLVLSVDKNEPSLNLYDEKRERRAALGQQALGLWDKDGNPRTVLSMPDKGAPSILLLDERQKAIWQAPPPGE